MKISTRGRYALRIMADLASFGNGEYVSLKTLVQRQGISMKYMEQIMRTLATAALVESARGSAGGYRLKRHPKEYTVKEILECSEGELLPVHCVGDDHVCERCQDCLTNPFWKRFYAHLNGFLEKWTLADVVEAAMPYSYII